jgi:hypothetical protein
MAFQPPSLTEPGVSSPTRSGCAAAGAGGAAVPCGAALSRGWQAAKRNARASRARFMRRGFYGWTVDACQRYTEEVGGIRTMNDEMDQNDGADYEDDDEQIEQMIIENGILLHSLATLLVRKGVLKQEEIDAEMDRLYDEMENFEQQ